MSLNYYLKIINSVGIKSDSYSKYNTTKLEIQPSLDVPRFKRKTHEKKKKIGCACINSPLSAMTNALLRSETNFY